MRFIRFTIILLILSTSIFSQKTASTSNLVNSIVASNSIKLFDSTNKPCSIKLPAENYILLYKYRGKSWMMDNKDSIGEVEKIINKLQESSPVFKNMKVICYAYNQDNFLNNSIKLDFQKKQSYTVEYFSVDPKNTARILQTGKLSLLDKRGKVLFNYNFIGAYSYEHYSESKTIKAKFLTEKDGIKSPLVNAVVFISSENGKDTLTKTNTDKYGDFELTVSDNSENHLIQVDKNSTDANIVIMATQEGEEITKMHRTADGFQYKLIPAEVTRIAALPVYEDITLVVNKFVKSSAKEFFKTEDVSYDLASYRIAGQSKKILDQVVQVMFDNPKLKLEVISHTDAIGDEAYNMELSQKRSLNVLSYLILMGVEEKRLSSTGKGETEIRNRCVNGVDCSEKENRFNRRTEFKFIKE